MCDIKEEEDTLHKEGGKARSERNEVDIQKLITTLMTVIIYLQLIRLKNCLFSGHLIQKVGSTN